MSWIGFAFALIGVFLAQAAVRPFVLPDAVDLLWVLTVVIALRAPVVDARLAGWFTGFAADLGTHGPLGLHALACGLAALALTYLRDSVNLNVWWVRALLAFAVLVPAELLVRLQQYFVSGAGAGLAQLLGWSLTTGLVSAALATLVLALPGRLGAGRRRASLARW